MCAMSKAAKVRGKKEPDNTTVPGRFEVLSVCGSVSTWCFWTRAPDDRKSHGLRHRAAESLSRGPFSTRVIRGRNLRRSRKQTMRQTDTSPAKVRSFLLEGKPKRYKSEIYQSRFSVWVVIIPSSPAKISLTNCSVPQEILGFPLIGSLDWLGVGCLPIYPQKPGFQLHIQSKPSSFCLGPPQIRTPPSSNCGSPPGFPLTAQNQK